MQFAFVEVIKTKNDDFFIEWDMVATEPSESIDDFNFKIWWSRDPVSGFLAVQDEDGHDIIIDGAVGPLTYNHTLRQYDFNQDSYYKVQAIPKGYISPSSSVSSSASRSLSPSSSASSSASPSYSPSPSLSPSPSSSQSPSRSESPSVSWSPSPSSSASQSPSSSDSPSPSPSPPPPGEPFFSDTVFIGMYSDGIHEVIKHAEGTLYDMYQGEPCFIIKRKSFGARCPTCWSTTRQQRMRTHCDTCHGTGFVVGYYQPIDIQITFDSDPKKHDLQKEWESVYDTKRARMSNYPLVRPKDLVVNKDDYKRYVVKHVDTTKLPRQAESATVLSKQNYIVSQILILEELNPDDNEYFLDIDNIPTVPTSDEGQTGSTLPFFNDHKPVTVDPPLTVDANQHVVFHYNSDDFEVVAGALKLKNGTGSIGISTYVAGEIIPYTLRAIAVMNDGRVKIADSTQFAQVNRIVGIGLNTASVGENVLVQGLGKLSNTGWDWEMGKNIFFDTDGVLTQSVPTAGIWVILAKPISPTVIDINIHVPVIRP